MTDKEEKDYCKYCSVEPPAIKFKCPECEHNPDKEIIIDGVDVSGCRYYLRNIHKSCGEGLVDCQGKDCIFKQLARKTQECEELKIENEELNDRMAEVTYRATGGRLSYSNYTLDAIEQAFNDQLEILSNQKVKKTKQLEQKNKELETELDLYKTWYRAKHGDVKNSLDRYHKAFEEIEEICRQLLDDNYIRSVAQSLIDIINKAKGE